ncbi:MAG: hypothetical protein DMF81_03750 [Acidobacteria bacterium]|nr:MAG: hypothetical protein DMF81_03750 [Acidobacteriota bacterium]
MHSGGPSPPKRRPRPAARPSASWPGCSATDGSRWKRGWRCARRSRAPCSAWWPRRSTAWRPVSTGCSRAPAMEASNPRWPPCGRSSCPWRPTWRSPARARGGCGPRPARSPRRDEMAKRVTTRRAAVPAWLREQGTALMGQIRARLDVEGRKALRQMEAGMADLQERLRREKAVVGRRVDEGVKGALARLNIPNRREISELTRKVDELSRKIDALRTRSRRRRARA